MPMQFVIPVSLVNILDCFQTNAANQLLTWLQTGQTTVHASNLVVREERDYKCPLSSLRKNPPNHIQTHISLSTS